MNTEKTIYNNLKIKSIFAAVLLILVLNIYSNHTATAQEVESTTNITNKVKLQAVLTPPYVIGPGDLLSITDRTLRELFGQVEKFDLEVSADGYISIPLPDGTQENVLVAGLTLEELSNEIRTLFGKTLKNPLVFVQISKHRPTNIYIGGEIVKPGVYKVETNTLGFSLTEAIQLAGGIKPRANVKSIVVTRGNNSEKETINLLSIVSGNPDSKDINLQPGDAIFIPPALNTEDQAQNFVTLLGKLAYQDVPVSVVGEVKSSGNFILPNDATLLDAIGRAGGITSLSTLKNIRISRYDPDGIYKTEKLDVDELISRGVTFDQIALKPNDTIELEVSKKKVAAKYVRDASINLYSLVIGGLAGNFFNYYFQGKALERQFEFTKEHGGFNSLGGLNLPNLGNNNNSITIIGNRKYNNPESKK